MRRAGCDGHRRKAGFALAVLLVSFAAACAPAAPRLPAPPAVPSNCVFTGVETVVAVGDLHGAYEPFVRILTELRLLDNRLHWSGGRTHLVQMGDVMDRGPDARRILDLIRRLEVEAREAGGAVHMLLGNHEELNILGLAFDIKGYVTPEQFRSFLPVWSRFRKETEKYLNGGDPLLWERFLASDFQARNTYTKYFNDNYGRWLARRPVILKINDVVFVHGGLTETLSKWPCQKINAATAREYERVLAKEIFEWSWIYQTLGPLWYRDLAVKDEETIRAETDRILANLGARAIVIGHTPTADALGGSAARLGGKIWVIDSGIWMNGGGRESALVINGGTMEFRTIPGPGKR